MTFYTGGSERMRLDTSGNVGIGTSSPGLPLDVYNATSSLIRAQGDSTVQIVAARNSTDTTAASLVLRKFRGTVASPSAAASGDTTGSLTFQGFGGTNNRATAQIISTLDTYVSDTNISGSLAFNTNAGSTGTTERMRINSSGNVGIGTSAPDYLLTLQTTDAAISMKDSGGTTRAYIGVAGAFGSAPTGALRLRSDQGGLVYGFAGTEQLRIDTSGNVGIGTSSPSGRLHVRQDQNGTTRYILQNRNAAGTPITEIDFITGAYDLSDNRYAFIQSAGGANQYLAFGTGEGASPSERMRIDSSGNVGIGVTPSGSYKLEVATGAVSFTSSGATGTLVLSDTSSGNGCNIKLTGNGATTPSKYMRVAAGTFGIINNAYSSAILTLSDSGDLAVTGNVTAYSDARLKKNVSTIDNALALVEKMRGVRYERIEDGKASVGVIAQEMQEVVPEVVHKGEEHLSVAYGNLVGVLIEAVKELSARVKELEAK
jgi:hypothetical protein